MTLDQNPKTNRSNNRLNNTGLNNKNTSNGTPVTIREFVPLNAPRLAGDGTVRSTSPASPAQPVDWFRNLAPELSALRTAPTLPTATGPIPDKNNVHYAHFKDMEDILREEHERKMIGDAIPPQIVALKYEAEQTARQLVGEALAQAQSIEDEASQRGYQAGFDQGFALGKAEGERQAQVQAQAEREVLRGDVACLLAHIEAERQRTWNTLEPEMIRLVFELARLVIKQEVEVSRDVCLGVVRNALRRVTESGTVRIRVNSEDLPTIRGNRDELLTLVDNLRHLEIIEDRRVGVGGCIVETEGGNIDARLETQLAEAANLLDLSQ